MRLRQAIEVGDLFIVSNELTRCLCIGLTTRGMMTKYGYGPCFVNKDCHVIVYIDLDRNRIDFLYASVAELGVPDSNYRVIARYADAVG